MTVIKPEPLEEGTRPRLVKTDLQYLPGTLKRFFVLVPDQSTWATVQIRSKSENSSRFVLHTVVLLPKMEVRTLQEKKYFELSDCTEVTHSFAVRGRFFFISTFLRSIGTSFLIINGERIERFQRGFSLQK